MLQIRPVSIAIAALAILLALGLARAQDAELPPESTALDLERASARKAAVDAQLQACKVHCEPLRELANELANLHAELQEAHAATATLASQKSDAQKEKAAAEREHAEASPEEAQQMAPARIELLEEEVRSAERLRADRQEAIERGLSELTRLRRQQEDLANSLASLPRATPGAAENRPIVAERRSILQQRRDLAGLRIKTEMESLSLARQRLETSEEMLARRGGRLSSVRLSAGIPQAELERTQARLEALRSAVAERAAESQARLQQVDEKLQESREKLASAEAARAAADANEPGAGPELDAWLHKKEAIDEAVTEAQGQIEALGAARNLVLESSHLDEFLLDIQNTQLQHDRDFNRLLQVIRNRKAGAAEIEEGLGRFRERLNALESEKQALQITSDKLRGEAQRTSEQMRHTALRLDTAMQDAEVAGEADLDRKARVESIEALLHHEQAISESISGRRNLIEEALAAAEDQLKKYQDSVKLLETYVSGALRFNADTLAQTQAWLAESLFALERKMEQFPAYLLELRLSLQDPAKRKRAFEIAAAVGGGVIAIIVLDVLLARSLRRKRKHLESWSRGEWLITGSPEPTEPGRAVPGGFLMPDAPAAGSSRRTERMLVFALDWLHRPLEVVALCLFAARVVPEVWVAMTAASILALTWLLKRLGNVAMALLFSPEPEVPSLRLVPRHAAFVLWWTRWVFLIWPPLLALYAAAILFEAPVHVRLTAALLALCAGLVLLLPPLVHGRAPVVRLIHVQSAREKASLPVLFYNRLIGELYVVALIVLLGILGLYGAGYATTARWLATAIGGTVAIVAGVALLVRGLHVWYRRSVVENPLWGAIGSPVLHLLETLIAIGALLAILVVWGVELVKVEQRIELELGREVFVTADGRSVTLLTMAWVLLVVLVTVWLSRRFRDLLQSRIYPHLSIDRGQQLSLNLLVHYGLLLFAGMIGLNMLGINLTTLRVVLGAIGLGVGFGLQTIVNNFVSGLIMLFERNVRPDDIIDFGGTRVRVDEVRARATIVTDEDNKVWIVPNVRFMNETITNWTTNWAKDRYMLYFYVLPTADLKRLRDLVDAWVLTHPDILPEPKPDFRLSEVQYGALKVGIWFSTTNAWPISRTRSRIYIDLVEMLQREGIQMPLSESRIVVQMADQNGAGQSSHSPAAASGSDGGASGRGEPIPVQGAVHHVQLASHGVASTAPAAFPPPASPASGVLSGSPAPSAHPAGPMHAHAAPPADLMPAPSAPPADLMPAPSAPPADLMPTGRSPSASSESP